MQHSRTLDLREVIELVAARLICGNIEGIHVDSGFSSDLMSDVLTLETDKLILITGLANLQTIRTAEMADIHCILFVRKKRASPEMIKLAQELGMVILETDYSLFKTSGILYSNGLKPVY